MTTSTEQPIKRSSVRFKPDKGVYAFVDPRPNTRRFAAKLAGLVIDQSYKGCAIVIIPSEPIEIGQLLKVKLGPLAPLMAEVRWFRKIDNEVYRVGLQFQE